MIFAYAQVESSENFLSSSFPLKRRSICFRPRYMGYPLMFICIYDISNSVDNAGTSEPKGARF